MANTLGTVTSQLPVHIYYEDTDFSGFVYHANYLKFFERAREHLLGISYLKSLYNDGFHFVVHSLNMRFLAPAVHGDLLHIETTCEFNRSPSVLFRHTAKRSHPGQDSTMDLVTAEVHAVLIGVGNRPVRLPADLLAHLTSLIKTP